MNQEDSEKEIDGVRFPERTNGFLTGRNVVDETTVSLTSKIKIPGRTLSVFELIK